MTWTKDFRKGWNELVKAQTLDKATYVVERGIEEGHSIGEIDKSLVASEHPISRTTIKRYIDVYALSRGGRKRPPLNADQIDQVRRDYEPDVSEEEVEEYSGNTGASPGVARRILEMEQIGNAIADKVIRPERLERYKALREQDRRKTEINKDRLNHDKWMRAYGAYWKEVNDFLAFLRNTKQDAMRDSTIANKLRRMAANLEVQADRYEIGYSKQKARQTARKGA